MPDYVDDKDLINKSVKAGEVSTVKDGNIIKMVVPWFSGYARETSGGLPPALPAYWSQQRDYVLSNTIHYEASWAAAIGIAITKVAALSWEIQSDTKLHARRFQEIFLQADGRRVGWVGFLSKHLLDYLLTDNGAFVEIVRATKATGSRIVGIRHLSSKRCIRTGDPKIPVIYRAKDGRLHELKDHQVFMLSDMPDSDETYNDVGHCAASRAYKSIYKLAAIEWYVAEKVSGKRPLAIYIVNGMLSNQIEGAINAARESDIGRGVAAYMGGCYCRYSITRATPIGNNSIGRVARSLQSQGRI